MANLADPSFRETKPRQGGHDVPVANLFRLDQRTIIITGGVGFLGVAIAQAVVQSGGDVVCIDRYDTAPGAIWAHLTAVAAAHNSQVQYQQLDITKEDAIPAVFASFVAALRYPIRGLVACAGLSDNDPAHDFSVERFRKMMNLNVTGTFAVAQAVALEMRKADVSGSIVLVASMSGTVANKGVDTAAYNTSKSAILQLTRSLAAEWGGRKGMPLIRVNSLSPGYIRTVATEEALAKPGMEDQWTGDSMLFRLSEVDEYRGPVLFLLGDGSSYMTGSDLRVDGGHCAW